MTVCTRMCVCVCVSAGETEKRKEEEMGVGGWVGGGSDNILYIYTTVSQSDRLTQTGKQTISYWNQALLLDTLFCVAILFF